VIAPDASRRRRQGAASASVHRARHAGGGREDVPRAGEASSLVQVSEVRSGRMDGFVRSSQASSVDCRTRTQGAGDVDSGEIHSEDWPPGVRVINPPRREPFDVLRLFAEDLP